MRSSFLLLHDVARTLAAVNDQHITAIATIVQDFLLLVSAVFVGWYLWETRRLRQAAERQAEAPYFPAVVAKTQQARVDAEPVLENIGNGPAIEVEWFLPNSNQRGSIEYLEAHSSVHLGMNGLRPLYEAGAKNEIAGSSNPPTIECRYRSLSGTSHSSSNSFDAERVRFISTFTGGQKAG